MPAPLRELGEKIVDTIERPSRREARSRSCNQILLGGQRGKDLPTLGHEAETCLRDPVWGQPDEGYAFENGTPAAGGEQTHNGTNGRGLAHSVAAEQRDDFTSSDAESDVEEDLRRAIGGLQLLDPEHPSLHLVADIARNNTRIAAPRGAHAPRATPALQQYP